jgi:hypothetical protein
MIFGIALIQKEIQAKEICHCYFLCVILFGGRREMRVKNGRFPGSGAALSGAAGVSLLLP